MTSPCAVSEAQFGCTYCCSPNIRRVNHFVKHSASSDDVLHPCDVAPILAKAACTMYKGFKLTYT